MRNVAGIKRSDVLLKVDCKEVKLDSNMGLHFFPSIHIVVFLLRLLLKVSSEAEFELKNINMGN